MRQSILLALSFALLAGCQSQLPLALNTTKLQAASAPRPAIPQIQDPALPSNGSQADPLYGFRKPIGTLKVDLYTSSDREAVMVHIKAFFRKYVDQNDIVNYQVINQDGNPDIFFLNIFGGNKDFVLQRLLPDLKYYLNQRSRFDSLNHYASS